MTYPASVVVLNDGSIEPTTAQQHLSGFEAPYSKGFMATMPTINWALIPANKHAALQGAMQGLGLVQDFSANPDLTPLANDAVFKFTVPALDGIGQEAHLKGLTEVEYAYVVNVDGATKPVAQVKITGIKDPKVSVTGNTATFQVLLSDELEVQTVQYGIDAHNNPVESSRAPEVIIGAAG